MTAAKTDPLTPRQEPDVIVVGAGTFGSVLAWQLGQVGRWIRTLVLESGRLERAEHVQNAPVAEETVPPPILLEPGAAAPVVDGVRWRVPWRSHLPYHGLAYGGGGRSLFWGAYCVWPELGQEGVREHWPSGVRAELDDRYLPAAAELLGLTRPAPHFDGELNRRLRDRVVGAVAAGRLLGIRPPEELPEGPGSVGGSLGARGPAGVRARASGGLSDAAADVPAAADAPGTADAPSAMDVRETGSSRNGVGPPQEANGAATTAGTREPGRPSGPSGKRASVTARVPDDGRAAAEAREPGSASGPARVRGPAGSSEPVDVPTAGGVRESVAVHDPTEAAEATGRQGPEGARESAGPPGPAAGVRAAVGARGPVAPAGVVDERAAVEAAEASGVRASVGMEARGAVGGWRDVGRWARRLNMPLAIDVVRGAEGPRLVRFSSAPLLNERLRDGTGEVEVLTDCHVVGLRVERGRVVAIETGRGVLRVPERAVVVLAVGTIENARLVLGAEGVEPREGAAHGLTTHLRSNVTVRVPFPFPVGGVGAVGAREWGAVALHLRGSCAHPSGPATRFHHQITAYGVGAVPEEISRRLYADTPRYDVEAVERALREPPRHLVVTLASVGEAAAAAAGDGGGAGAEEGAGAGTGIGIGIGEVTLLGERDEFGARRAYVRLAPGAADLRTWEAMDRSADAVVRALVGNGGVEVLRSGRFVPLGEGEGLAAALGAEDRREPLGCGHHEMGTLRMGPDPLGPDPLEPDPLAPDPHGSHTDSNCRLHAAHNVYVAGPAVFPALDSAGPVLPGIALTLRLADHLREVLDGGYGSRAPSAPYGRDGHHVPAARPGPAEGQRRTAEAGLPGEA